MANLTILNKVSGNASIFDVVAPAGLTNGNVVVLGTQATNKTYACAAPAAVTDNGMVLVATVSLPYEVEKLENDYTIATGEIVRTYVPYVGMVVSIPVANVTATAALAVGKVVVPKAGALKMECLAAPAGTEVLIFNIDEMFTKAGVAMVKLRCIKAV
jgi:hypothetical protein